MYIEQKYLLLVSSQLQQFKKKGDLGGAQVVIKWDPKNLINS